eukprot:COSAG06_NODE_3136_length_5804_cov_2.662752_2_plen_135_part_00
MGPLRTQVRTSVVVPSTKTSSSTTLELLMLAGKPFSPVQSIVGGFQLPLPYSPRGCLGKSPHFIGLKVSSAKIRGFWAPWTDDRTPHMTVPPGRRRNNLTLLESSLCPSKVCLNVLTNHRCPTPVWASDRLDPF